MPIYSIRPSESTMLSVLLYAQELLVFQRKDNKQLSMMSSILSHVTDGIILYAKGGAISHINERAASFLGIPVTTKNMRDIFPDWTEGRAHLSTRRFSSGRRIRSSPILTFSSWTVGPNTS